MKEYLKVENFGPIKFAEFENLEEFVLFVGKSGSGKSTLMRLIKSMRELCTYANVYSVLSFPHVHKTKIQKTTEEDVFKNNNIFQLFSSNTIVKYEIGSFVYSFNSNFCNDNFSDNFKPKPDERIFRKCVYKDSKRNCLTSILSGEVSIIGENNTFVDMFNDFMLELKEFPIINIPFLGLSCKKIKNKYVLFNRNEDKKHIGIENAPSSFQNVLPIVSSLNYYVNGNLFFDLKKFVISILLENNCVSQYSNTYMDYEISLMKQCVDMYIEEPENGLFPEQQVDLMNFIVRFTHDISTKKGISIMASTHSPYILNYVNVLLVAGNKKKNVNGAHLNFDEFGAYFIEKGVVSNLKLQNARCIDASKLTNTLGDIYDKYKKYSNL